MRRSHLRRRRMTATTSRLPATELAVLTATAHGHSARQIAAQLVISRGLVRTRLGSAQAHLSAASLPHAVALAIRHGLIDPTTIPDTPEQPQ